MKKRYYKTKAKKGQQLTFVDKWAKKMQHWESNDKIMEALTSFEQFAANPEAAFGVVRELKQIGKLDYNFVGKFMAMHPAWKQTQLIACNASAPNDRFDYIQNSDWGKNNKLTMLYERRGTVVVEYETRKGTKQEEVFLSCEWIVYNEGKYSFMGLNMGGSRICEVLLKDGTQPNMAANDDHNKRRHALYGERLEEATQRRQAFAWHGHDAEAYRSQASSERQIVSDDACFDRDFMSKLLNGETITL